jgi:hypothetical protein
MKEKQIASKLDPKDRERKARNNTGVLQKE